MAKSSNKSVVPEAREALNRFKMEAANEVGVNLKQGYNGDLTSREAGSVGGQMVKDIFPVRTFQFSRNYRWLNGHKKEFLYKVSLAI
ncbi:MAG: alpha/beta-type small acid-soluble spore protein [Clostridia bacterium]|nr:alpha/beta-type small acid-soluble spore protein [Clostridia bacterium]